jgi:hypothetical protein
LPTVNYAQIYSEIQASTDIEEIKLPESNFNHIFNPIRREQPNAASGFEANAMEVMKI